MKPKSKKEAILKALLDGQKLTTKSCMALCGTHKLTSRLPELEQEFGFKSIVKKVSSKSRYGGVDYYNQYSIDKSQRGRILVNFMKSEVRRKNGIKSNKLAKQLQSKK